MSKPITSKRFIELCNEWGIKYIPIKSGWATHNRNHKGEFVDVFGVMIHHTGKFSSVAGMESILWNGYQGLPGPLCHTGIDPAGILRLAGWGRTNHAGLGSSAVLRRVMQSDLPRNANLKPGDADTDGNAHFYGFEIFADGHTPMTEAQRITAVRVTAMLCTEHGWKADVIAHGEWQQGKWDPGANGKLIPMGQFRTWVDQAMREGPKPKLPTRPAPKPTPQKTIRVGIDDTLWSLAEKHLGDGKRWPEFVESNSKLINLEPGMTLIIPKK